LLFLALDKSLPAADMFIESLNHGALMHILIRAEVIRDLIEFALKHGLNHIWEFAQFNSITFEMI
jgi:hypothetical protein